MQNRLGHMKSNIEIALDKCEQLLNNGDIDGADNIIRPLARFSRGGPHHARICDLEERIVDIRILMNPLDEIEEL